MADDRDRILLGAIAGAHGVRGEVRLKSFCAEPSAIADYGPLSSPDGNRRFSLTLLRPVEGGFVARLAGVDSREAAEALRGTPLYAPRAALVALPDDEFYHADLIGLAVEDAAGAALGRVKAVHNHGAGDFLEIQPAGTGSVLLLPFTRTIVPVVDLAAGRIVVDPPATDGDDAEP